MMYRLPDRLKWVRLSNGLRETTWGTGAWGTGAWGTGAWGTGAWAQEPGAQEPGTWTSEIRVYWIGYKKAMIQITCYSGAVRYYGKWLPNGSSVLDRARRTYKELWDSGILPVEQNR